MKLHTCFALLALACVLTAGCVLHQDPVPERRLSFTRVISGAVVKLDGDTGSRGERFHGNRMTSDWIALPRAKATEAGVVLAREINRLVAEALAADAASPSKPGTERVVFHPLGPVVYDYGLRIETDRGRRDFMISLPTSQWPGYIDAYGSAGITLGIDWKPAEMTALVAIAPK